jgi:hypothetical protein
MELLPNSPPIDRPQAFLLYATFCGDVVKTAHALNVSPVAVLRVVDDEGWTEKLKGIIELKNSGKPGDLERGINRALNFVQAHRMRLIVERAIRHFTGMTEEAFAEMMTSGKEFTKDGKPAMLKMSTRAIADLASALEKAHACSYQALGDTAQDRGKRKEAEATVESMGGLHAQIAAAMAKAGASQTPRAMLLDAQLDRANAMRRPEQKASPLDSDDH